MCTQLNNFNIIVVNLKKNQSYAYIIKYITQLNFSKFSQQN